MINDIDVKTETTGTGPPDPFTPPPKRTKIEGIITSLYHYYISTPRSERKRLASEINRTHQILCAVAGIALLISAFTIWANIIYIPFAGFLSVLTTVSGIGIVVAASTATTNRRLYQLDLLILILAILALIFQAAGDTLANPGYGTDEAAFIQYSANLFLHGHNPYGRDLTASLTQFRVPVQYATYTTSGQLISNIGYPAFSILYTALFILITGGTQAVIVGTITALIISLIVMWKLLPAQWRSVSIITITGFYILYGFAVIGLASTMFIPMLMIVAYRWTQTGQGGHLGRLGTIQAILLGAAFSVNQLSWFVIPFLLIGIYRIRRHELGPRIANRLIIRYILIATATATIINLPFLIQNPIVFIQAVLSPLTQHAIPYGQGLIDLADFANIGGGNLALYSYGAMLTMLALLLLYTIRLEKFWAATFMLPSLALLLPSRSLAAYWLTLTSIWIVAITTNTRPRLAPLTHIAGYKIRRIGLAALFIPGAFTAITAIASPSPLTLHINHVSTNGQLLQIWRLDITVSNHSNHLLTPHYATDSIGQMTAFWHVDQGPVALAPHEQAHIVIEAPDLGSMPAITHRFQLEAVTSQPQTVSVTPPYTANPYTATLSPSFVNQILPSGTTLHLQVQARTPYGDAANKTGLKVQMSQVIYGQEDTYPAEAQINSGVQGQTPITASTNAHGIADFYITARGKQYSPIYIQAWILSTQGYPYGYSAILSIRYQSATTPGL